MVEAILRGYHAQHPDITRLHRLGTTHQGRAVWALRVNDDTDLSRDEPDHKPALLLNGAHHGDELLSVDYALDALQQVLEGREEARVKRWIAGLDLWFVPLVNPDGNHVTLHRSCGPNMGRKNGRDLNQNGRFELKKTRGTKPRDPMTAEGVDLNRNYPFMWAGLRHDKGSKSDEQHSRYRGAEAASEPETRMMTKLANEMHFVAAISWHTNASKILSPYTIPGVQNPTPDVAWDVAGEMLQAMSSNIRTYKKRAR
ncbi:MAG: M14 family zinc carboxypeptidase, partial [Myxococcota bacterium]|nr:M14 family zinc carboxypeptidase [Myxococcota bacterium]